MALASASPSAPINAMYTHEIDRMLAEPNGAADTAPTGRPVRHQWMAGRNGAR